MKHCIKEKPALNRIQFNMVSVIFKELKLLRVDQINELEISILMFKYNSGQAPYRLNQLFKPNHMVHSCETRNRNNCYIPYRSSRLGQYSLSFQGPKIWNSVDNKTKDTKSVFSFKKCIKAKISFSAGQ